jgi:FkbM family methyltransferase
MNNAVLSGSKIQSSIKCILRGLAMRPERIDIPVEKFLASVAGKIGHFVKIGSNDGVKNDPFGNAIDKYHWKGIMVEPFEQNFEKLKANFGGRPNVQLEQAGITEQRGSFDFYYIENIREDEPGWYDQVGSFDKETFIKNIEVVPSLLSRIACKQIPCMTFADLLQKYAVETVDLIHIDTEGYDYKILKTIDLKKVRPMILIFEYEWLTQFEFREAKKLLTDNGYKLYYAESDCVAVSAH